MGDRAGCIVGTRWFTCDSVEFKDLKSLSPLQLLPCFKTNIVTSDEEAIHFLGDAIYRPFQFCCPMTHPVRKKASLGMVACFHELELLNGP